MSKAFIVIAMGLDETQSTLMHEAIKRNSADWWHEMPNVWIAVGGPETAKKWTEILRIITPLSPSGFMVLELAGDGWPTRSVGYKGGMMPKSAWAWFAPEPPALASAGKDEEPPF